MRPLNVAIVTLSIIFVFMLGALAGWKSRCEHNWKQGVSFDEAKELTGKPPIGALFKCLKCNETIKSMEFPAYR